MPPLPSAPTRSDVTASAGASARAVFARRATEHAAGAPARAEARQRRTRRLLIAGCVLTALGAPFGLWPIGLFVIAGALVSGAALEFVPAGIRAWQIGARGELLTAHLLLPLTTTGAVVLHDRRIPRSRANIDHIVVSASGIWIIETKNYRGAVTVHDGELYVARRRRPGFVAEARHEADVVGRVVEPFPVGAIIVIHRATFPLRAVTLDGVPILPADRLMTYLAAQPAIYQPHVVGVLAARIDRDLPPAAVAASPEPLSGDHPAGTTR